MLPDEAVTIADPNVAAVARPVDVMVAATPSLLQLTELLRS
jgi:hypothetical protein